ncbi:hypothetical protein PTKU64_92470 (plasmid) [Paraburkholderia terrae]|uniref:HNH endonuclease n=1 Tax=Paraburkholderia terrae TaxID=311230 RepID=A0ABN6K0T7_9BURK|nr:hypothetical protein [Paraburkholderia terrae]BCZ85572.1 hypothetical protein PTKU64_92470 [Paraburkholderia terrae]
MSTPTEMPKKCAARLRDGSPCKYPALPSEKLCGNHKRVKRSKLKKTILKRLDQAKAVGRVVSGTSAVYHVVHYVFQHWPSVEHALNQVFVHSPTGDRFTVGHHLFPTVEKTLAGIDASFEHNEDVFVGLSRDLANRTKLLTVESDNGRVYAGRYEASEELQSIVRIGELAPIVRSAEFQQAIDDLLTAVQWAEDELIEKRIAG